MPLLTFASAILVIVGLNQLIYKTALGRAFRATSDDVVTAGLMGIRPNQIFAIATGLAMVIVTIAALYLGTRANFDPTAGPARLIYAFEAVIIGGLGSLWGTLAGGIILGVAQTLGAAINRNGRSSRAISPSCWSCCSVRGVSSRALSIEVTMTTNRDILSNVMRPSPSWRVETRTRLSSLFSLAAILFVLLLAAAPFVVSRGVVQDLFFILTMLALAQSWNLLAGYAGLISVGQQLFVGCGAYALFGFVILLGLDPILAIPLAGLFAVLVSIPTAFFAFRLYGPYFAIGTWVIAEVGRLLFAQWKALGGGTGTSLPREATRDMFGVALLEDWFGMRAAAAADAVAFWLALVVLVLTIWFVYRLLRSKQGLGLAAVRDNETAARALGVDARS